MTTRARPALLFAAVSAFALFTAPIGAATGGQISVEIDQASLVRLERPAATIVMGNPSVADVSLRDGTTAFVIGRTFGTTNMIVLDAAGIEIANIRVQVGATNGSGVVVLSRGSDQHNYNCATRCERVLVPGDGVFTALQQHMSSKIDLGVSTAGADSGSAGE